MKDSSEGHFERHFPRTDMKDSSEGYFERHFPRTALKDSSKGYFERHFPRTVSKDSFKTGFRGQLRGHFTSTFGILRKAGLKGQFLPLAAHLYLIDVILVRDFSSRALSLSCHCQISAFYTIRGSRRGLGDTRS